MLEEILRLVVTRRGVDAALIADALDLSPALVVDAVEELTRRGYLQAIDTACPRPCAGCPLRVACLSGSPPRVWSITDKGRRLVAGRAF